MISRRATWLLVFTVISCASVQREAHGQYGPSPSYGPQAVYAPGGGADMYGYGPYTPSPYAPGPGQVPGMQMGMQPGMQQYAMPASYYGPPPEGMGAPMQAMGQAPCSCSDCQAAASACGSCGHCDTCYDEPDTAFGGGHLFGGRHRAGWFQGDGHGYQLGTGIGAMLGFLAPYGEGGCCAPHWFDIHAEAVFLKRDTGDAPYWEFSRYGSQGPPAITSDDVAFDTYEPSLRITGTYQTGAGSNLEFTYFGLNDYSKSASAYSADDQLYAIFGNYGLDNEGNPDPDSEIEQLQQAEFQELTIDSDFDSLELNFRRRWTSSSCLVQGSWLFGVRYIDLSDTLSFYSYASRESEDALPGEDDTGGTADYVLKTRNFMTGAQLGGDAWVCLLPGLRLGFDGKAGIYGNNCKSNMTFASYDLVDNYVGVLPPEALNNDKVSFMGEGAILLTYQVNARFALRGGYQLVYFDGVATGMGNVNPAIDGRVPQLNDGSSLTYDGYNAGIEWMW